MAQAATMLFRGYSLLRPRADERLWPILICLLVRFHLLVFGKAERICSGGNTSGLLQVLASEANAIGSRRLGRLLPNSTSLSTANSREAFAYVILAACAEVRALNGIRTA